jgi:predicted acyltransferase (DUF342 family)
VSGDITVDNQLLVNTQVINNNLIIGQNADFKGNFVVEGRANLTGTVCAEQDIGVGNNLTIAQNGVVLGTITVGEAAFITGSLQDVGNVQINGNATIDTDETVDGNLLVLGTATFNDTLTTNDSLTVNLGETINSGGLTILADGASITTNFCINGNESVSGDLTTSTLTVDGNSTFNNLISGTGTLTANNPVVFNDGLVIAAGNQIIKAGDLILSAGDLTVGGSTTLQSKATLNGGAVISGGLTVNGSEQLSQGGLDITSGSLIISGNLFVSGAITGAGAGTLDSLTLTDTINSTGPASGTLIVDGGVGIARDLWEGGSEYLPTASGIASPLDYYEESTFSTGFIWGGVTVAPTLNLLVRIVRVGDLVNILIPNIIISNAGTHIDVISSTTPLPTRFRPFVTVRGAASTIIYNSSSTGPLVGELGEFNVSPGGTITLGLPGTALGPQTIASYGGVQADYNSLTYTLISGCTNHICPAT